VVYCKNIGGGPGDGERRPPRLTERGKAKGPKKVTMKKCKHDGIEAERVIVVAATTKRAERGHRGSGIHIGEAQFHLEGTELGTE
jgi:hypothetical protein